MRSECVGRPSAQPHRKDSLLAFSSSSLSWGSSHDAVISAALQEYCQLRPPLRELPACVTGSPSGIACFPSCGTTVGFHRTTRFCRTFPFTHKRNPSWPCYPSNTLSLSLPISCSCPGYWTWCLHSRTPPFYITLSNIIAVPSGWWKLLKCCIPVTLLIPQTTGFFLALISSDFIQHYTPLVIVCMLDGSHWLLMTCTILVFSTSLTSSLFGWFLFLLQHWNTDICQGFVFAPSVFSLNCLLDLSLQIR